MYEERVGEIEIESVCENRGSIHINTENNGLRKLYVVSVGNQMEVTCKVSK